MLRVLEIVVAVLTVATGKVGKILTVTMSAFVFLLTVIAISGGVASLGKEVCVGEGEGEGDG